MKKYLITRILGNDLPTIHGNEQTIDNLLFTVTYEEAFDDTDKVYVLNRIIDNNKKKTIMDILNKHNITFFEIMFDDKEYKKIPDVDDDVKEVFETLLIDPSIQNNYNKHKLSKSLLNHRLYIMNINMARNCCIDYGKKNGYEWTFVLDSNSFFTEKMYNDIIHNIQDNTDYITIPQIRLLDRNLTNDSILQSPENLLNLPLQEHQIAFKNTSKYMFNEQIPYGTMNKGEMLNALGVSGKWNYWNTDLLWLNIEQRRFVDARYQTLSSVIRLNPHSELNSVTTNWLNRLVDTYRIIKELAR